MKMEQQVRPVHLVLVVGLVAAISGLLWAAYSAETRHFSVAGIIGGVMLALAGVGLFIYMWKFLSKREASVDLLADAATGALPLHLDDLRPAEVALSQKLLLHFGLQSPKDATPLDMSRLTCADLTKIITAYLNAQSSPRPEHFAKTVNALKAAHNVPIAWHSKLDTLAKGVARWTLRTQIEQELKIELPEMHVPRRIMIPMRVGAAVVALAIMVTIAILLDNSVGWKPSNDPFTRIIGKAIGWVVFIGLTLVIMIVPGYYAGKYAAMFPPKCETAGQLAVLFGRSTTGGDTSLWTPQSLWPHLRPLLAECLGMSESEVTGATRLRGNAPRI